MGHNVASEEDLFLFFYQFIFCQNIAGRFHRIFSIRIYQLKRGEDANCVNACCVFGIEYGMVECHFSEILIR